MDNRHYYPVAINRLFKEVDNSPLIAFRIIFGSLLCYHVSDALLNGTVYKNFIQPPFTFNFIGFDFLQPLPGHGMYFYFGLMVLLTFMIILGAWYRLSMAGFTILWAGIYFMQKSDYNNHYYLVLLLCFLMVFMPANQYYSWDAKRKAVVKKDSCPQWVILLFIAQVAVIYFFAAISKLSADWFSGKFMAIQFSRLSTQHIVGMLYGQKWFQLLVCYGGFFFDLLIIPLLIWKRTRRYAFLLSCAFHVFNSFTFRIGIFPYLSIALNLFFIEPEKVRRFFFKNKSPFVDSDKVPGHGSFNRQLVIYGLGIYLFIQVVLPMRSWFFPGNVFWTEEGYRMSWKMMLRSKTGKVYFKVIDTGTGKTWNVDPSKIFTPSHVMWIAISPDITWQYAQRIKKHFTGKGFINVEVYAIDSVSLNRSPYKPLVNPSVNLAAVKWHPFSHSDWIMPYKKTD
ncbi:MAG: HTTM domain-containing protein [Ginsengibacter sp.]